MFQQVSANTALHFLLLTLLKFCLEKSWSSYQGALAESPSCSHTQLCAQLVLLTEASPSEFQKSLPAAGPVQAEQGAAGHNEPQPDPRDYPAHCHGLFHN